jgi:hypothetical protein
LSDEECEKRREMVPESGISKKMGARIIAATSRDGLTTGNDGMARGDSSDRRRCPAFFLFARACLRLSCRAFPRGNGCKNRF